MHQPLSRARACKQDLVSYSIRKVSVRSINNSEEYPSYQSLMYQLVKVYTGAYW